MILTGEVQAGTVGQPWLVFLHGFSGDAAEWQPVGEQLSAMPRLYLDLPGHGGSADIAVADFAQVDGLLRVTLISYNILDYWLVGYSLGGRIAMYHACQGSEGLRGLIVEGAHPGLSHPDERHQRRVSDAGWAERFRHEPLPEVFADWYQQPVFASLTAGQRQQLIALRSKNNGRTLAAMLQATSLAEQTDLRPGLSQPAFPFYYLFGERDNKFAHIAGELAATCFAIPHAGHNAHRDNPAAVTARLCQILRLPVKETL
ncbi:2-succinyl-6-hydroxy-2,4-cyclohexadiene-1-carboxylate synthase [Leclercia pneumoniae]|uniref:2-succinyl-6-hydroxy-2, 4-cyclohexadiene-1-carboxylate synthase n=1 Tax=Leclercia pneumoniae TaxID=2815358 RepID=UPI003BF5938A